MGDFFTKADWRPGKNQRRIKRINHYGGCKVAPVAFVANAVRFTPGRTNHRKCSATKRDGTPCGMLALREYDVCGAHGGYLKRWQAGKLATTGKRQLWRTERVRQAADRAIQAVTLELAQLPIYQAANDRDRMRLLRAWQTSTWPTIVRAMLAQQRPNAINNCV